MTDEQIEKKLKRAISDFFDCAQEHVVTYINRLIAENADLAVKLEAAKTDKENLLRTLEECNEELQTIRKETAKEILQSLFERADIGTRDENNGFAYACLQFRSRILAKAKKYGVELNTAYSCDTCSQNNNAEWNEDNCPLKRAGECMVGE